MLSAVDFSNAGDVTYGEKAFNNCPNLKSLSSNHGKATLKTLSFGNAKKLEELNWNAKNNRFGMEPR